MIARHTAQRCLVRSRDEERRMSIDNPAPAVLKGKKALVVGIANEHSIAYGCAKAFRELGADLAITYLNEKARPYVEPLARELEAPLFLPLDVAHAGRARGGVRGGRAASGARSTSSSTRSHSRPRRTCRAGSSTARPRASPRRWTCPATRSCAWHGSPRR